MSAAETTVGCPRVVNVLHGHFVTCGESIPCAHHGAPLFVPGRVDDTDPNRRLPPHPRSIHCGDKCANTSTLFDTSGGGNA